MDKIVHEVPHIDMRRLPEEERHPAFHVQGNLQKLVSQFCRFRSCLDLSFHARGMADEVHSRGGWQKASVARVDPALRRQVYAEASRFESWYGIAAAQGAIVLNGFCDLMDANRSMSKQCPTLMRTIIDNDARREAETLFNSHFPRIIAARTSAAHPGLFGSTPKHLAMHSVTDGMKSDAVSAEPGATVYIESALELIDDGIRYSSTFNKSPVGYDLTNESVEKLLAVLRKYMTAFVRAEDPRATALRQALLASG